mgnify:FL=1|jgi:hypothetical protein|tara:strand:- start:917 stop:1492 length:576 start_codon:yes stop_codon:yes gene_type:complete
MANVDKAFGLRALGNLSATGSQKQFGYNIADNQSGAIFQGQLVTLKDGFILAFDPSSHTAAVGVFNGCNYIDPTTGKPTFSNFYPGSINITQGEIIADVMDDPNQLFLIQADEDIEAADIGKNADIVVGSGSTTTGLSVNELDSSTIATTAALNLKIVGLYDSPNNAFGNFAVVVVKINEHLYGSAGVAGQ